MFLEFFSKYTFENLKLYLWQLVVNLYTLIMHSLSACSGIYMTMVYEF